MAAEVTAADRTTQRLSIAEALDCACAASAVRQLATATGFPGVATEEIVLVCAELASNIVKHAGHGALILRAVQAHDRSGIELDAQDAGPGITNVDAAFADGYSTLGGLGYGLGSVNRLMDEIDIESTPALGTRIVCRRWLRCESEHTLESRWDVGAATRSRRFAPENGDAYVVKQWQGNLLIALIDGLGHGAPAQQAAIAAQRYVHTHYDLPLQRIFTGVSRACRATRGVVMALARFESPARLIFASIGNVEACVHGAEPVPQLGVQRGMLGVSEPHAVVQDCAWRPDWMLVLYTDGVRGRWSWRDRDGIGHLPAQEAATQLLRTLGTDDDDATIVVAKGPA